MHSHASLEARHDQGLQFCPLYVSKKDMGSVSSSQSSFL